MILDKEKLIFVHIPKNAGTSIKKAFNYKSKGEVIKGGVDYGFNEMMVGHKHWTIGKIKKEYPKEYASYKKFAIIRNPYERMVSWYAYLKRYRLGNDLLNTYKYNSKTNSYEIFETQKAPIDEFKAWVKNPFIIDPRDWLLNNQCHWIDDTVSLLRLENLNEDLNSFFNKEFSIDKKNGTSRYKTESYYDEKTSNIVYDRYKEDFEKFNYKKL